MSLKDVPVRARLWAPRQVGWKFPSSDLSFPFPLPSISSFTYSLLPLPFLPLPLFSPLSSSLSSIYDRIFITSPSLHPRVFSIIPVPTISSLHSLHYFPIFPHYQKSPVPPFIPFPPHLGTNFALSVPAKSFPPHPGTNFSLFVPKSREGKIRQRKGGETN